MTNSRSRSSTSKLLAALVVACAVVGATGVAHAERKRVVVLDFEGPKGEKFHDDLVRLLKKTHTVVPTHQWNGTAEQLDAATTLERDVRRVAKRLKVDAIVEGKIEKRRDAFLIHLKLREGKTGEVVRSMPKDMKVVVSGVNVAVRHRKPSQLNPQGGLERKEAPMHVSKVAIADPKTGRPTRVRFETGKDGKKFRVAARSGEKIDG